MIKDYHIHPQIMRFPERFHEFADVALKNGVEEICITDHMPLIGSSAGDRIPHGKVSEYCSRVQKLQEAYAGRLRIKCGIEIDYHPTVLKEIESVLQAGTFDFVLGSSHLHALPQYNIFDHVHTRGDYARAMLENTVSAAESGYFDAIAHMDMHRWIFSCPNRFPLADDGYTEAENEELTEKALDAIKHNGLRLEINPHFAIASQNPENLYPSVTIVRRALKKGVLFSYGSDAHVPGDTGAMLAYLRKHEIYKNALKSWEAENPVVF